MESLPLEEINAKPRPSLTLRTPRQNWGLGADKLIGELEFDYDGAVIPAGRTTPLAVSTELGLVIRVIPRPKSAADVKLFELGFREARIPGLIRVRSNYRPNGCRRLPRISLPLVGG